MKYRRLVVAILVSAYFIYYAFTYTQWHFIDTVNLIIHESGHVLFGLFGSFMQILGGSLWQILLPALFVVYFLRWREYFSASLVLFWVGQNFLNVSVYARDAIMMQLPLLGGDAVQHDWNTILSMTHRLTSAPVIAMWLHTIGLMFIGIAVCCSFFFSLNHKE